MFSSRIRATHAEIRLSNLTHNFRYLRGLLKDHDFICPMIKANAYGHGDVECARALSKEGAHDLGVVLVEEGIRLREAGILGSIFVFGTFHRDAAAEIIKYNLTPVISRMNDIRELEEQVPAGVAHAVHLKFNTGMNRLGFEQEEAGALADALKKSKRLRLTGICTHLLQGEDAFDSAGRSVAQIGEFEELSTHFDHRNLVLHALNSSGLCSQIFTGVGARPGISLYGAKPALNQKVNLDLRPVMTLKSRVELVRQVKKGETVSYGGTWTAQRESVVGVVPYGYADGYPRHASNKSFMLVKGQKVPVVGIVCMDYTMLDLTDVKGDCLGEEVVLIGKQGGQNYSAEELAEATGTISYEIFTRVSPRVPRVYLHEAM